MELRQQLDETFYNDFYKRACIFLTYYQHLFGDSKVILSIIEGNKIFYKGLDCMELGEEVQEDIDFLKTHGYSVENKRYLTTILYGKFHDHTLENQDFGPFNISGFMEAGKSALDGHEKNLIKAATKGVGDYSCISLPLIRMAGFAGAINILWQPKQKNEVSKELLISSAEVLVKMFTREYESMLVFRDLDFLDEANNIQLKHQYEILARKAGQHSFLKKLGYPEYYEVFGEQFLRYNKKILDVKQKVDSQDIKTAIISIVVDSFAHNVGAHSLTALKWWIQKRSEFLDYKFRFSKKEGLENFSPQALGFEHLRGISKNYTVFNEKIGRQDMKPSLSSLMSIIKHMPPELEDNLLSFSETYRDLKKPEQGKFIPRFPVPIDYGVWTFLEYMRDKSAFWSGVSRDIVYSGESISWYDLLWRDFINNPLFLGTIAHSEGIHKLNIWLEVCNEHGEVVEKGIFAKIDLSVIDKEISQVERLYQDPAGLQFEQKEESEEEQDDIQYSTYGFVRLAAQFEELKSALEELPEVFLPNGIIGKHAFYTILENTLRNVKHFKDEYARMQKHGIDFHISIQPHKFEDKTNNLKAETLDLFKVGLWLEHPIQLVYEVEESEEIKLVFFNYLKRLSENIVNQYGRPNLGGNSQDKICAAMLLNNTFKSVMERDPEHVKLGYSPYIHIESMVTKSEGEENGTYEPPIVPLEGGLLDTEKAEYMKRFPIGSMGFIKKYLYMWKAESLKVVDERSFDVRTENISRFRIIAAKNISLPEAKDKFRLHGVIRIISHNQIIEDSKSSEKGFAYAYLIWLREWLNWQEGNTIETLISIRNTPIGLMKLDERGQISYQNYTTLYDTFDWDTFRGRRIELSHGDQQAVASQPLLEIRSHGIFLKHFYDGRGFGNISTHQFDKESVLIELFEAINTKVCIIDNRIYTRMPEGRKAMLGEQLNLHLFPEQDAAWHGEKAAMLKDCNFLILHLSFIESFDRQKYTANEIDAFVRNEIGVLEELPENFIMVITTGRGRSGWLETIENPKITFRPIESLVDALEDGLSMQDFFQVKYNLTKVLMGS